jgi:hypothetical protein
MMQLMKFKTYQDSQMAVIGLYNMDNLFISYNFINLKGEKWRSAKLNIMHHYARLDNDLIRTLIIKNVFLE